MNRSRVAKVVSAVLLAGAAFIVSAQAATPSQELTTENFIEHLNQHKSVFDAFRFLTGPGVQGNAELKGFADQIAATSYSFLGRPNDAIRQFPIHDREKAPDDLPDRGVFDPMPAVDWIAAQSANHQIIMINESHHRSQTRLLTLALLPKLRALGFKYFAAETFGETPLQAGYPTASSGYYTRDPIFSEIVREAAALGYTLVPYEFDGKNDDSQQARETGEARRLAEVIARDPTAKILVHAGYGHISEAAHSQPRNADPMALEFKRLTGLPVLSVDQTALTWEDGLGAERLAHEFAVTVPSVLLDHGTGNAWSATPEKFDASVVLPTASPEALRPDWLALGGKRHRIAIDMTPCIGHLPCLVTAQHANEGEDAIPADQFVMLDPSEAGTPLFLAPGSYRLQLLGNDDHVLGKRELVVLPKPDTIQPDKASQ
ncbi:MAG: hypothetical protein ABIR05_03915 [Luteimonas sp.]